MKIDLDNANSVSWHYLHPCALLHAFSKRRPEFGDLLRHVETQRVIIYMDEITPGNVLRPDHGKSVAMWYWTLLDLPDWYIGRNEGWFYFAAFPVNLIGDVTDGYSYLFARMVEFFWKKKSQ